MKIQCDACEKAPAVVICCADEAALCERCDVEIHEANKLASKHQRLLLDCLTNKFPVCDICQERAAFIFCVEDRALFCRNCDEAIHIAGTLSANHQRYLATGIRVALSSMCNQDSEKGSHEPANQKFGLTNSQVPNQESPSSLKVPTQESPSSFNVPTQESPSSFVPSAWTVDEFLQLSDYESGDKKESPVGLGELEWFPADIGLFHEQIPKGPFTAAEVPELRIPQVNNAAFSRNKVSISNKKPRIEISDNEDYFTVPDLG